MVAIQDAEKPDTHKLFQAVRAQKVFPPIAGACKQLAANGVLKPNRLKGETARVVFDLDSGAAVAALPQELCRDYLVLGREACKCLLLAIFVYG